MNWSDLIHIGWTWYTKWTGYKQMQICITRLDATDYGIFGKLKCNGFECVTLERHDIAIPEGTYPVTLYASPSHGNKVVPLLHNVPNRDFIEIHSGNWETDSKGCILVGMERDGKSIGFSQIAFEHLMDALKGQENIECVIA